MHYHFAMCFLCVYNVICCDQNMHMSVIILFLFYKIIIWIFRQKPSAVCTVIYICTGVDSTKINTYIYTTCNLFLSDLLANHKLESHAKCQVNDLQVKSSLKPPTSKSKSSFELPLRILSQAQRHQLSPVVVIVMVWLRYFLPGNLGGCRATKLATDNKIINGPLGICLLCF